jgi:S1-C subfamily serine protease
MLNIFKITISIFLISFFSTAINAEENFCLDNDGLILPLFEEIECVSATDIKINEKEFIHIIEFDESERLAKLNIYRENKFEIEKIEKEKLANKSENEIKQIKEDKKELDQKKISNLAKLQEEKRIARQKELEIKKELKKEERIAKKKLEEKLRKEKLARKKISDNSIIKPSDVINDKLKIIYFDKEIVKAELLPNINSTVDIDFETLVDLNLDVTKNLLASNSNLILIIPKDIDSFSTVTSEDSMTSQMVAGIRQVPNPEFNRLQMEIRRAEREQQNALARAEDGFRKSQCYSCGLITQWGGLAIQTKWNNVASDLQSRIVSLTNSYSTTPDYLEKEVLRSYNYVVQNVNVEKKALYQIIQFRNNKYIEKNISIDENKKFKVAYNIDPQDKKYETLLNKYSDTNQVTSWQNQKIKNIALDKFSTIIDNQESFKEITGKKELYASLNFNYEEPKELSWWERLFGSSKKENKKTASLSNKSSSNYEVKDVRFDSVVIVKTESGLGSGFFISNDEILTNYHVIENSSTISVTDKFGKRSSAVVIKKDLKRDLALLKTNTTGKAVTFYSGQLKQGEMVEALGHPKGRKFSLTKGWISAIRKESAGYGATNEKNVLFIQTDAAINHGNSGGPLFYKDKVVGVNTQGLSKDRSEGMNFAVHFSEVNQFLSK